MNSSEASQKILHLLQEAFADLQGRYPGYSLRRFSRKLDVPAPVLSSVLNRKRFVTRKLAEKLLRNLDLRTESRLRLTHAVPARRNAKANSRAPEVLPAAEFNVISDWWNFAVLRYLETKRTRIGDSSEIVARLHIPKAKVDAALADLVSLGLLRSDRGFWAPTRAPLTTTMDIPSSAIRKNHAQGLELAAQALAQVPVEYRDFSAITVTFDPSALPALKETVARFRRDLLRIMEASPAKEVYRCQFQIFPLTTVPKPPLKKERI